MVPRRAPSRLAAIAFILVAQAVLFSFPGASVGIAAAQDGAASDDGSFFALSDRLVGRSPASAKLNGAFGEFPTCGDVPTYEMVLGTPSGQGKKAFVEGTSIELTASCPVFFQASVAQPINLTGPVEVQFFLGCDGPAIPELYGPAGLVFVDLIRNGKSLTGGKPVPEKHLVFPSHQDGFCNSEVSDRGNVTLRLANASLAKGDTLTLEFTLYFNYASNNQLHTFYFLVDSKDRPSFMNLAGPRANDPVQPTSTTDALPTHSGRLPGFGEAELGFAFVMAVVIRHRRRRTM